jgi:hypothetical protein
LDILQHTHEQVNAHRATVQNMPFFHPQHNFFKPADNVVQRTPATIQLKREMTDDEAIPCLKQAETTLQTLEGNMKSTSNNGKQDYITGAVKMLRTKMTAKKIKCYFFDGTIHGEDDYSGDEIRLDGVNLNFVDEGTLLHEGVHAYQASQHQGTATKYAAATRTKRNLDPQKPADLELIKWKAWTEYWAYRAKYDYFNPTRKQPMSEEEIDKISRSPDVIQFTNYAHTVDQSFDPKTYAP